MNNFNRLWTLLVLSVLLTPAVVQAYPIDGYTDTGIRRVEGVRRVEDGTIPGSKQPPGALLPTTAVDLRLLNYRDMDLPAPDPAFTRQVLGLLGSHSNQYGIAVLDLSNPEQPRYAEHRGDHVQNVGSVGKLIVALGLFQALADAWPDDIEKRREILKNTVITADEFCHWDHHKIRIFNVDTNQLTRRTMKDGDQGSLWEYLDWTLSVSSNAAAAMTMREAMLLRHFGKTYPVPEAEIQRFFRETPGKELTALFQKTFFEPITRNGLDLEQLRQGSFFTREGKHKVNGGGNSYGTARELMKFVLRMEQGRLVDEFSSRQIKRLLYMTERRIRYASSPALKDSAVYFKSGSLYSCKEEEGFKCGAYMGNVRNYMNSVAIVEYPPGDNRLFYISTLISNVLRQNSAVDHQTMGTRIHRLIEKAHPEPVAEPVPKPAAAEVAQPTQ
ncbi:MAG: serine hydrolase [Gammaproteobacteria bacterium]